MANQFTSLGSTSLGGTVGGAGLLQKAYDKLLEFQLRSEPMLRQVADKKPVSPTNKGNTITMQFYQDLPIANTPLSETVDPDSVSLATPTTVNITINEYGNSTIATKALKHFSLAEVDPAIANIMAYNMADSIDSIVLSTLRGGTYVQRSGGAADTASIAAANTLRAADVRKIVAKFRKRSVVPRKGSMYWFAVHPETSHDLRAETGAASWRDPHVYSDPSNIWAGEIGAFEGGYFIESPRLYSGFDGAGVSGSTSTRTTSASSASGSFTLALTATVANFAKVGYLVTGTGVGTGARVAAISADGLTVTLTVANSGTVASGATITFQETVKVYNSFAAGKQALAEAVAEEPHTVIGPMTDKLMRLQPIGWYGVLGFALYRQEALYRIESSSTISAD